MTCDLTPAWRMKGAGSTLAAVTVSGSPMTVTPFGVMGARDRGVMAPARILSRLWRDV